MYLAGQTDKVTGTGVFKDFKLKREDSEKESESDGSSNDDGSSSSGGDE